MKKLVFFLFLGICMNGVAQEKATGTRQTSSDQKRTPASSVQATSSPLPYDVNDKYMGRKGEFLNNLTVSALPVDFPVYDKKMSLDEYNIAVDNYYRAHTGILKEQVKQKLIQK